MFILHFVLSTINFYFALYFHFRIKYQMFFLPTYYPLFVLEENQILLILSATELL